jgi:hypothetical protein
MKMEKAECVRDTEMPGLLVVNTELDGRDDEERDSEGSGYGASEVHGVNNEALDVLREGQSVFHEAYGKTKIDCIPMKTTFESTELSDRAYLTRVIDSRGEIHDPWVPLAELILRN